jgi:photosystem II stability/assembly factor-like uncharacterized protein
VLAYPRPGEVVLGRNEGNGQQLIASFDSGARWSVVYSGWVSSLTFVDPNEGFGLVRADNGPQTSAMIMTFDGGRHWKSISF